MSLKINILSRKTWQRPHFHTLFFLSPAAFATGGWRKSKQQFKEHILINIKTKSTDVPALWVSELNVSALFLSFNVTSNRKVARSLDYSRWSLEKCSQEKMRNFSNDLTSTNTTYLFHTGLRSPLMVSLWLSESNYFRSFDIIASLLSHLFIFSPRWGVILKHPFQSQFCTSKEENPTEDGSFSVFFSSAVKKTVKFRGNS